MSDGETLNSNETDTPVPTPKILDAVKSYLSERIRENKPVSIDHPCRTNQASGYIRRVSQSNCEPTSGLMTPGYAECVPDHATILCENNEDLRYISNLLSSSIPEMLNEALILVIEERSRREKLECEVEAVRERWKADVAEMRSIIASKSRTIRHLLNLHAAAENGNDAQLNAALSEIQQLHTIINTIR